MYEIDYTEYREAFADALLELIIKKSITEIKTADIISNSKAGKKSTFYRCFHSKYDVISYIGEKYERRIREVLYSNNGIELLADLLFATKHEIFNGIRPMEKVDFHKYVESSFRRVIGIITDYVNANRSVPLNSEEMTLLETSIYGLCFHRMWMNSKDNDKQEFKYLLNLFFKMYIDL